VLWGLMLELEVRIRLGLTPGNNVSDQQSDVPIYYVLDVLWGIIERVDPLENASVRSSTCS
jgi:hypothetical protein